jgi:peptidoglycan/LPS O-acetylase OafA/YrhL
MLYYLGLGLLAAMIVLPAIGSPADRASRIGKWLGDRSYGIYLWHFPIVQWVAGKGLPTAQYIAVSITLTLIAAHLSYRLIEQPLLRRAGALHRVRAARGLAGDASRSLVTDATAGQMGVNIGPA